MRRMPVWMAVLLLAACQQGRDTLTPRTEEQRLLYMLGVSMARQHATFHMTPADLEHVYAGMRAQVREEKEAMELEITSEVMELAERRHAAHAARAAGPERERARRFLEQAAREEGVVKTESGLLFRSLVEGTGPGPTAADMMKVHFRAMRMDGGEFENTYKHQPLELPVGQSLRCFAEAVPRMKAGGKAKLVCPPELAFGDEGMGDRVPGGAAVVIELELLEFSKPTPQ